MPPWELPGDATRMGFMTRSKDGSMDNASFLFFEDSPGNESVQMHSEKDMMVSVENDKTVNVDGHRKTTIKKTQTDTVTGAVTLTYKDTWNTTVTNAVTNTFNGGEKTTIQKGRVLDITSGGDDVKVNGGRKTEITGTELHHVTGKLTENYDSGLETVIKSGQVETITGGVVINVNSGNWEQHVNAGTVLITSPQDITLKSTTNINLTAPKSSYTIAGHKEAITGNNFSLTGASESITGAALDLKAFSAAAIHTTITHNVISISHKTFEGKNVPMKLNHIKLLMDSGALHWSSKALTLLL